MENGLLYKYLTEDVEQLQCSTALHLYLQQSLEHKEEKVLCVGPWVTIIFQNMSPTKVYACEIFRNWSSTKFKCPQNVEYFFKCRRYIIC